LLFESTGVPRGLWTSVTAFAALCAGFLYVAPHMPRWASLGIFSLEALLALAGSWLTAETLAALGRSFSPFTPVKIAAMVVAILCPSLPLGIALIAMAGVLPVLQTLHWAPGVRSQLPQLEPAQSVVVAIFAIPFLLVRRRRASLEQELARTRAERLWLERLIRLALLVRNLTLAPVEAARRALSDVRRHRDHSAPSVGRMENALARLDLLNETIEPLARLVPSEPGEVGPDEVSRLMKELQHGPQHRAMETLPRRAVEDEARRASIHIGALGVIAGILGMGLFTMKGYPTWPALLLGSSGIAAFGTALAFKHLPHRAYQSIFVVHALVSMLFVLVTDFHTAQRGPYDAFIYMKFLLLTFAFVAPSGRLGAALIGLSTLAAVATTYLWFSAVERSRMPMLEPWLTVTIGLTALGVLAAQRQDATTVRDLALARAERSWMWRVARLALSVRDYANTPLQTLSLDTELLKRKHADPALAEIEAALVRLQGLNKTLLPLNTLIEWGEHGMSFDALETIAAEVRATLRESEGHVMH
jgi:hypothetical protein